MKKEYAIILFLAAITCNVDAQWTGHSNTSDLASTISRTGMIAIDGYNGPQIRLNSQGTYYGKIGNPWSQVWSLGWGDATTSFNNVLTWTGTNNVGIGTSDPWERLHVDGTLGVGKFDGSPHSGLKIEYTDGGSGTTVFKHQRWGGNFYFKRNDSSGEKTQLFFGGAGNHYMDIYNSNNEVKVRFNTGGVSYFIGGNVGVGTDGPDKTLTIDGELGFFRNGASPTSSSVGFIKYDAGFIVGNISGADPLRFQTNSTDRLYIENNGNVGIGTTTPGSFKLAVEGKIGAREVNVTIASPWPDYVFESDYKLPSLSDLEQYIKTNKHLPDVPTAEEVKENGLSVGEMNAILLKKVEELTLHILNHQKQIENQQNQITDLKNKIK